MVVTREGRPLRYSAKDPAVALPSLLELHRRRYLAEHERQLAVVEEILSAMKPDQHGTGPEGQALAEIPGGDQQVSGGF